MDIDKIADKITDKTKVIWLWCFKESFEG
jgi:hypothetical protein